MKNEARSAGRAFFCWGRGEFTTEDTESTEWEEGQSDGKTQDPPSQNEDGAPERVESEEGFLAARTSLEMTGEARHVVELGEEFRRCGMAGEDYTWRNCGLIDR